MSSERDPENEQDEKPSVIKSLPRSLVSNWSNLSAESLTTRLSTRHRKPSEHLARRCCACQASPSSGSDQRTPHQRPSGDDSKASVKKTSLPSKNDNSESKHRRSALNELVSHSRERDSVRTQQCIRTKCGSSGRASTSVSQKKARETETSMTTLIEIKGTRAKRASTAEQIWRKRVETKDVSRHNISNSKAKSPAQVGLSKQPSKMTYSSPITTGTLKKRSVPKLFFGKDPKGQSSHGKKDRSNEAKPKVSTGQSKQSMDSDSDPDSSAGGSDFSSETIDDFEHHINWDDVGHRTGENCGLCEEDLAVASWGEEYATEFKQVPEVSVLACGHAFHSYCLETAGFRAQEGDPVCILCESAKS